MFQTYPFHFCMLLKDILHNKRTWYYPIGQKIVRFQQNNIRKITCYNVFFLTFEQVFGHCDCILLSILYKVALGTRLQQDSLCYCTTRADLGESVDYAGLTCWKTKQRHLHSARFVIFLEFYGEFPRKVDEKGTYIFPLSFMRVCKYLNQRLRRVGE